MEPTATHIGIEPGSGLIGRFGDTVILIPGGSSAAPGADGTARDLFDLAAAVASGGQRAAGTMAARLAAWVIGHMTGDVTPFGIVTPVDDGVVVFLRGAVWCSVTEGSATRQLSGEQALTWVDQMLPGTFERLAIGGTAGRPVRADPMSDLREGVVPGQGFVLTRIASAPEREPAASGAAGKQAESAAAAAARPTSRANARRPASKSRSRRAPPRRPRPKIACPPSRCRPARARHPQTGPRVPTRRWPRPAGARTGQASLGGSSKRWRRRRLWACCDPTTARSSSWTGPTFSAVNRTMTQRWKAAPPRRSCCRIRTT